MASEFQGYIRCHFCTSNTRVNSIDSSILDQAVTIPEVRPAAVHALDLSMSHAFAQGNECGSNFHDGVTGSQRHQTAIIYKECFGFKTLSCMQKISKNESPRAAFARRNAVSPCQRSLSPSPPAADTVRAQACKLTIVASAPWAKRISTSNKLKCHESNNLYTDP